MTKYINRIVIAFSILINALLGGKNNQTFSARNWQLKRNNKPNLVWLIDRVFFWEKDHCQESWIKWTIINSAITRYNDVMGFPREKNPWE
jgi:hypothetical protein